MSKTEITRDDIMPMADYEPIRKERIVEVEVPVEKVVTIEVAKEKEKIVEREQIIERPVSPASFQYHVCDASPELSFARDRPFCHSQFLEFTSFCPLVLTCAIIFTRWRGLWRCPSMLRGLSRLRSRMRRWSTSRSPSVS